MIYLRTAWRRILRDRLYSGINITGLALGLSVCTLIVLFVTDEWSYDKYNEKADRIFRIASEVRMTGSPENSIYNPPALGKTLVKDFPAVEAAARIRPLQKDILVRIGASSYIESNAVLADSTLFDIFTLPFLAGNPHNALASPNSVVLSASTAERFFGRTDVLGRTLRTDDDTTDYVITGIMKDMPRLSHFHLTVIKSLHNSADRRRNWWVSFFAPTYILTVPGTTSKDVDRMLATTVDRYVLPEVKDQLHNSATDLTRHGVIFRFYSIPLTRIHLYSNMVGEFEPNGQVQYIYIFLVIAGLILLVACVNFTNLATARAAGQAREVGVRKVIGASRKQLIRQFLLESFLTSFLALLLALAITTILLPWFNQLAGKSVEPTFFLSTWTLPGLLIILVLVSVASGGYPAFFLSAFQPIKVLQNRLTTGFRNSWLRSALLIFQFGVAIVLIIGTIVIYSQLYFIRHRQLGYNREQVLTVKNTRFLVDKAQLFANEVKKLPGIINGTVSGYLPNRAFYLRGFFKDASGTLTSTVLMGDWRIDADYFSTLGMKLVEGRNFSPLMPTDSGAVLINETAARVMGLVHPLGKNVYTGSGETDAHPIIGVIKDFNAGSLREPVGPIVFSLVPRDKGAVSFRIDSKNIPALIAKIRHQYNVLAAGSGEAFVYSFLDDDFDRLYQADERTSRLLTAFSVFAILIACFGLLGLVTYAAERRTKEFGIRKVLGARLPHVVLLLSADFGKAVLLATLIACPVAAWLVELWLREFAFRTPLYWWIFTIGPLITAGLVMVVVGAKAARVYLVNPVESLRAE